MATAITTLASVKAYLGLTDTNVARDAILESLIVQCSAQIENFCQRTIGQGSYVEILDGSGASFIQVSQWPITGVQALEVAGLPIDPADDYTSEGYYFDGRQIGLNNSARIPRGRRNVRVAYTAGYSTIPSELEMVANKMVANTYKGKDWVGYESKSLAGETVSFRDEFDKAANKAVLRNYMNVVPK